ncbi:hypothetical protein EO244_13875 [Ancylomarina salipaludis]|uniref:NHL repeat containing protein n=1 Tax=Ancylomarina salipaludis TaxID=2501299 RepID=A0A4Q1JK31_9BACT|nr:hypothetical protein [Ancylomarina salipaludis]RXQ89867.1 hypothetical protein EO244_13875 [Ancylomarina salipaludis]
MKNKLTLIFSVVILLLLVALIAGDLFLKKPNLQKNIYEYDLKELRKVDPTLITYRESLNFAINSESVYGVAVDTADQIYVSGNDKLWIFDSQGKLQSSMKVRGDAHALCVSESGNILLGVGNRIDVRRPDGSLNNSFQIKGVRAYISSLAEKNGRVYIADAGQKIVHQYTIEGEKINLIGAKNLEKGIRGFVIPSPYFDLLLGRQGELWVVNPGRHAFEAYNNDGDLISTWERTSMQLDGFGGCCNPSHIAMLSDGSFVTSEKGLERIKIHLPSGDFKSVVAAPNQFDEGTKGLDLAVDSQDRIIVLDPSRKMVRVFELKE